MLMRNLFATAKFLDSYIINPRSCFLASMQRVLAT